MSDPRFKPTWEELNDAYGSGGHGWRQGELKYKALHKRWPELIANGIVRTRGGWLKLTPRGYWLWNAFVVERLKRRGIW